MRFASPCKVRPCSVHLALWAGVVVFTQTASQAYAAVERFTELARRRGDLAFAERCQSEVAELRRNIEANGWDGQWYRG